MGSQQIDIVEESVSWRRSGESVLLKRALSEMDSKCDFSSDGFFKTISDLGRTEDDLIVNVSWNLLSG
jgi:hypothetical protein